MGKINKVKELIRDYELFYGDSLEEAAKNLRQDVLRAKNEMAETRQVDTFLKERGICLSDM